MCSHWVTAERLIEKGSKNLFFQERYKYNLGLGVQKRRLDFLSGCYPLDPYYKIIALSKKVKEIHSTISNSK